MNTKISKNEKEKTKIEQIYSQYYKLLLYIAMEMLHDQIIAEDAVHEAFVKIIKNIGKINLDKPKETKRYIVVIIERTCLDILRKQKRQVEISLDALNVYGEFADETNHIECIHEVTLLKQILDKMPELTRNIFQLKYGSGYDNSEIAKMLHITEITVRQRILRGKREIKKNLRKEGIIL